MYDGGGPQGLENPWQVVHGQGFRDNDEDFDVLVGAIDEVGVLSRQLDPAEIRSLISGWQ